MNAAPNTPPLDPVSQLTEQIGLALTLLEKCDPDHPAPRLDPLLRELIVRVIPERLNALWPNGWLMTAQLAGRHLLINLNTLENMQGNVYERRLLCDAVRMGLECLRREALAAGVTTP